MSQRDSGYERKERDLYETPEWVTVALMRHLPPRASNSPERKWRVWEPAAGTGKMVRALERTGCCEVQASDLDTGQDFLFEPRRDVDAIITNPPYVMAQWFIERSLMLMEPGGVVAMLLRTDYDHAMGRAHLFAGCKAFAKKLVLRKRIVWFEDSKGAPSFNHAWFIWDWQHRGDPVLAYGP